MRKPGKQKFEAQVSTAYVDLEGFAEVPQEARPRRIYFARLSLLDRECLRNRGYEPMTLFELPRGSSEQEELYLKAKAQAIEEGTISADKITVAALELQMRNNNMLTQKNMSMKVKLTGKLANVEEMLKSWGQSRYTLRGNSTIQSANVSLKQLTAGEGKRKRGRSNEGAKKEITKVKGMLGEKK